MTEWIMAHPWMTFFLILALIFTLDNFHANWARIRIAKHTGTNVKDSE